jgi:eukaryotic-like serine/threonine-protein kinase
MHPALAELVEEFTRRVQNGETVDPEEYAGAHPEWAALLRILLATLGDLAQLSRSTMTRSTPVKLPIQVGQSATLGDFAIRGEIGRGGMGIVYEAEQISLGRRVALKVLPTAASLDARSLQRFQLEAQAAACLHHEHIVPVYAIGERDGVPYYAMQFIEGANLAAIVGALQRFRDSGPPRSVSEPVAPAEALALDLLADRFGPDRADSKPESPLDIRKTDYVRAVVRLAVQAAEGLQHAHEQGILHRDIKPANLLLDRGGNLRVTDFGLARIAGSGDLTATGDLPGTLRYMSPEQALGKRALIDRRSDIYSLGATLYELLTLDPAIDGQERWELLARIDREEPRALRRLNPSVPSDLATIVAKAMAKDVSARYSTAEDMGVDLNRFLAGRAIKARRAGAWEQGVRWCRRNPTAAVLLTALVAVFLAGFASVTFLWHRANTEADRANLEANRANQTARAEARARAAEAGLRIRAQAEIARRDLERGLALARQGDVDHGLLWMAEALSQETPEQPKVGRMTRANLSAWMGQAASLRAILEHQARVTQAIFRAGGRSVLTGSEDGVAQIWDTLTGRPIGPPLRHGDQVLSVASSPDERLILTGGSDGKVRFWDAATGRPVGPTLPHGDAVLSVAFSPDGRLVLTLGRDCKLRLWDTASGRPVGQPMRHAGIDDINMSFDGRFLLSGERDGAVRLWDVATGQPTGAIYPHDHSITKSRFSPDGRRIATRSNDGTSRLWDAATSRTIGLGLDPGANYSPIVFSPDGELLLTAGLGGTARLRDTASGKPIGDTLRHAREICTAAFSPDGKFVATGSFDHTARLWDAATGRSLGTALRHRSQISSVSFSPDGKLVLTASEDGTAKLWEVGAGEIIANVPRIDGPSDEPKGGDPKSRPGVRFRTVAFSPDRGRALVGSQRDGLARLIDTDTGQPIGPPIAHRWSYVRAVAFSPDGRRFATSSHSRGPDEASSTSTTCQIWDAATARPTSPLLPHINYASAMAFRPDGRVLATGDYSHGVHLWDVETGTHLGPPLRAGAIVLCLSFSPDGGILAAGTAEPVMQVVLWDLATRAPRGQPIRFKSYTNRLVFSPDGRLLAVASEDTTARLVDVVTGQAFAAPLRHADGIRGIAFSPDGRLLLTVTSGTSGTSAARFWDVFTGQPASPALAQPGGADRGALAFSPDGTLFATGCDDGSVLLWDVASAAPIGPPRMLRGRILAVAFRPDGRTFLAVDDRGDARAWPVPLPSAEPVGRLIRRVQVKSGLELDADGELAVLSPETWIRYREELNGPPPASGPADDLAGHEGAARDAEAVGDYHAARWHLDRMISAGSREGLLHARRARALLLAGDVESAGDGLARAIALGPRDRILDWLVQRSEDLRAGGRPDNALRLIDPVIAARPDDWLGHALRAGFSPVFAHTAEREADLTRAIALGADIPFLIRLAEERGRAGHWRSAAELYDRAIALGTVPTEVWYQSALAWLSIDDGDGYRRVCEALRSRHPASLGEPWLRYALAEACSLGPGGLGDDGKVRSWAEGFLAAIPPDRKGLRHSALTLLGGILYRSGHPREAIDRIDEGVAADDGEISPDDATWLAMAYHQSGDHARALQMLSRSKAEEPPASASLSWDALSSRLHRREAERLILDGAFPADPFAPAASASGAGATQDHPPRISAESSPVGS